MSANPHLSIIIPAYNEARRLPHSLERLYNEYLDTALHSFEIIVVDDGSTDGTADMIATLAQSYEHLRVLRRPHRGKGAAVRAGMLAARGRWRMMADADWSMPPSEIAYFLPRGVHIDIMLGSRNMRASRTRTNPLRYLIGRAYHLILRMMTGIPFADTQCGFKMFSQRAAEKIFPLTRVDGFAFDVEMLYLARLFPWITIAEMGIQWTHDPDSRVDLLRDPLKMLADVAAIAQRLRRERGAGVEAPAR